MTFAIDAVGSVLESAPTKTCGAEFVGGAVAYGREGVAGLLHK